jgi:glycine betaine/choline ABC-type transport system substrate-binding protein
MPPKKTTALGAALQPLDTNQETISLREARKGRLPAQHFRWRSWTRKSGTWKSFISKCKGKKENMAQLADLQKKIDEAAEEMRHLTQDDHDRRTQHMELRQESSFNKKNGMMTFIIVTLPLMMLLL